MDYVIFLSGRLKVISIKFCSGGQQDLLAKMLFLSLKGSPCCGAIVSGAEIIL